MKTIALVPAAGLGTRLRDGRHKGPPCPKQYRRIGQQPIISYTLRVMQECDEIDQIVVIVSAGEREFCEREILPLCGLRKPYQVVIGGAQRQQSVYQGLASVHNQLAQESQGSQRSQGYQGYQGYQGAQGYQGGQGCQDGADIIVIHDAARPLISVQLLRQSIFEARKCGACIVGVPVRDTLKRINEEGLIEETVCRSRLWMAQTPQSFRFDILWKAHQEALKDGFQGTDDSVLLERIGFAVKMIPGSVKNIKITYPEDLEMAEEWLAEKGGQRG